MSSKVDATPQATISRFSACVPTSATAASIDAIERWPPKNDELARRSTLALSTGSCASACADLRASTFGIAQRREQALDDLRNGRQFDPPAAMSLMKLGA